MIDFSLQTGTCSKYLDNLCTEQVDYDPDIIRNYPYFNYLLRSGIPNNFKYGKFGILLTIFLGIIKKLDASLVMYFDAFFYQLLKELDFSGDGLTIPKVETTGLKSFLKILWEASGNNGIKILSDNLNVQLIADQNSELEDILGDIEMLLCHVIVKYNVEQILQRLSVLPRIDKSGINKILFIKYFPRTLMLLKDPEIIPSEFLFGSPLRMFYYGKTLLRISKDEDVRRILELELKIFETKFFNRKAFHEFCDLELMHQKINNHECKFTVRVNDTISILRNYYVSDIDLEHWTGFKPVDRTEIIDVIVYYDYLNRKVRHQVYTREIKEILLFFWPLPHNKNDFLKTRHKKTASESLLNELIYKNILV
jgi:hypothetical protein